MSGCSCIAPPHTADPLCPVDAHRALAAAFRRGNDMESERDHWIRLFNRLEAAISHHKNATAAFPQTADEALYKARDKILADAADRL